MSASDNANILAAKSRKAADVSRDAARIAAEVGHELYLAKAAAEEANRVKTEFLNNLGHELLTPLNAVIGFTSVLQQRLAGKIDAEDMEFLTLAHKGGQNLQYIVDQMLELSRLRSHQYEIELTRLSVAEMIDTCLDVRQQQLREAEMKVYRELHAGLADVVADRASLLKCLLIFVDNAIKFSAKGSKLLLTADPVKRGVEIVVADHGIGIPADLLDKVTEPFFQVEGGLARKHGGIGLGLAIARALAELQGGKLKIRSHLGAGTSVHLRLPVA